MPEQRESQHNMLQSWKRNFNIASWVLEIFNRALTIPMRNHYGTQALGFPAFFALILMLGWWFVTHDNLMLGWIAFWLLCLGKRRIEANRLAKTGQVDSRYQGWPFDAIRYCRSEQTAKLWVEPILVGIAGFLAFKGYEYMGWSPAGLPYFLLSGVFMLHFGERLKQAAWQKRLQDMNDARMESEMALRDFYDQYGR